MTDTILAAQLARIIDDAAIFAGRDSSLPMINSVQFESSAKHLIAVATDRFTLGSSVADYLDGNGRPFAAMLRLPHALLVSKVAKSTKAAFTTVSITATGTTLKFAFDSGEQLTLPKANEEFPDWRKLFESRGEDDGSTQKFGVDPQYLARFGRVSGSRQHMVIKFGGPAKPAFVTIGTSFAGLIMPVRLAGEDQEPAQVPEWMARAPKKSARTPKAAARKGTAA